MYSDARSDIEEGMQLVAHLPDIMPQQASAQIKPIYHDIQQVLRVPFVNLIFRTLANYSDYLESSWREIRPLARSQAFERYADELRHHASLAPAPEQSDIAERQLADMEQLRAFNDTIHYVLPKLLLIVTALAKISPTPGKRKTASLDKNMDISPLPQGVAKGAEKVEMIDPEAADDRIKRLFSDIKQRHGHPLISSYYRGLANWPDVLESVWSKIAPYVGSPDYECRREALVSDAENHLRNCPPLSIKVNPAQAADIAIILCAFRKKFIPEMLLDAALIKSVVDGSEKAGISRFSVAIQGGSR